MKQKKRMLAGVLAISMILSCLTGGITAQAAERRVENEGKQAIQDIGVGPVEKLDYYGELSREDVPRAVGYETARSRYHVKRMRDAEHGMNNLVFQNADGSKTQYLFDYPVKYVDNKGKVKDSSFDIADSQEKGIRFESGTTAITVFD